MTESNTPAHLLPAIGLLAGVSEEHRSFLACFGKYLRPAEGDTVIIEGEIQDTLYVILSGMLHVVTAMDTKRPTFLAALGAGDSMGEIGLFHPGTASATVVVRSSSALVWSLSREELDAFLDADPVVGVVVLRAILGQLSQRIRAMNEKLAIAEKKSSIHELLNQHSK